LSEAACLVRLAASLHLDKQENPICEMLIIHIWIIDHA